MLCISGILIQSYETGWDYGYFCSISSPLYWCMQTYSHFTGFTNFLLVHRLYPFCGSHFSLHFTMALPCLSPRSCILIWLWSMEWQIPTAYPKCILWCLKRVHVSKLNSTDTLMLHAWVNCPKYARTYSKFSPSFDFSSETCLSKVWFLLGVPPGVRQLAQGVALLLVKVSAWWNIPVLFRQDSRFYF